MYLVFEGAMALTVLGHKGLAVAYSTSLKMDCGPFLTSLEVWH